MEFLNIFLAIGDEGNPMISMVIMMALIFGTMYLLLIRPQRKRDKVQREMRSQLEIGDEIITIGGIIGRVVSLREDSIVIETGNDRSKIRITRSAVQKNNTVKDDTPS